MGSESNINRKSVNIKEQLSGVMFAKSFESNEKLISTSHSQGVEWKFKTVKTSQSYLSN